MNNCLNVGSVRFDHLDLQFWALLGDENGRLYPPERYIEMNEVEMVGC